jgi:alpha/beta superfamily hydrolase
MQLLMRRPEIKGFISVAPPANSYDFSFLAPCPSSGLMVHGDKDDSVPLTSVEKLVHKLHHQRDIRIDYRVVPGADHSFRDHIEELEAHVADYLATALREEANAAAS